MTLKEAHELQRRELISLRAKVARLEKQTTGLFPVEEKEALERHIRHLEQVNKTESRRHEEAKAHWKLMESLKFVLELELLDVKEQLEVALSEIEQLRLRAEKAEAEVAMLNGTNAKLQKKLNTNFENSSLPSSALPFRKKVPNNRKPSGKKPGAQKVHKAHTATKLTATKEPVMIPAPDSFASNPDLYPTGKKITKQCISDITKGIVNISTGTIYNLSEEFSASTERAKIFSLLTHSDVLYSDATVSNISERQLRKFKRKQKQAVVLRSDTGGQHICDALTIIETAKMQNRNVYDTVEAAFIK